MERVFECIERGDSETLDALLRQSCSAISVATLNTDYDRSGQNALAAAASRGYVDCVRVLLRAGSDPSGPASVRGETPLQLAALSGHAECSRLLASVQTPARSSVSSMPLTSSQAPPSLQAQPPSSSSSSSSSLSLLSSSTLPSSSTSISVTSSSQPDPSSPSSLSIAASTSNSRVDALLAAAATAAFAVPEGDGGDAPCACRTPFSRSRSVTSTQDEEECSPLHAHKDDPSACTLLSSSALVAGPDDWRTVISSPDRTQALVHESDVLLRAIVADLLQRHRTALSLEQLYAIIHSTLRIEYTNEQIHACLLRLAAERSPERRAAQREPETQLSLASAQPCLRSAPPSSLHIGQQHIAASSPSCSRVFSRLHSRSRVRSRSPSHDCDSRSSSAPTSASDVCENSRGSSRSFSVSSRSHSRSSSRSASPSRSRSFSRSASPSRSRSRSRPRPHKRKRARSSSSRSTRAHTASSTSHPPARSSQRELRTDTCSCRRRIVCRHASASASASAGRHPILASPSPSHSSASASSSSSDHDASAGSPPRKALSHAPRHRRRTTPDPARGRVRGKTHTALVRPRPQHRHRQDRSASSDRQSDIDRARSSPNRSSSARGSARPSAPHQSARERGSRRQSAPHHGALHQRSRQTDARQHNSPDERSRPTDSRQHSSPHRGSRRRGAPQQNTGCPGAPQPEERTTSRRRLRRRTRRTSRPQPPPRKRDPPRYSSGGEHVPERLSSAESDGHSSGPAFRSGLPRKPHPVGAPGAVPLFSGITEMPLLTQQLPDLQTAHSSARLQVARHSPAEELYASFHADRHEPGMTTAGGWQQQQQQYGTTAALSNGFASHSVFDLDLGRAPPSNTASSNGLQASSPFSLQSDLAGSEPSSFTSALQAEACADQALVHRFRPCSRSDGSFAVGQAVEVSAADRLQSGTGEQSRAMMQTGLLSGGPVQSGSSSGGVTQAASPPLGSFAVSFSGTQQYAGGGATNHSRQPTRQTSFLLHANGRAASQTLDDTTLRSSASVFERQAGLLSPHSPLSPLSPLLVPPSVHQQRLSPFAAVSQQQQQQPSSPHHHHHRHHPQQQQEFTLSAPPNVRSRWLSTADPTDLSCEPARAEIAPSSATPTSTSLSSSTFGSTASASTAAAQPEARLGRITDHPSAQPPDDDPTASSMYRRSASCDGGQEAFAPLLSSCEPSLVNEEQLGVCVAVGSPSAEGGSSHGSTAVSSSLSGLGAGASLKKLRQNAAILSRISAAAQVMRRPK